jgi:hypothetical protein
MNLTTMKWVEHTADIDLVPWEFCFRSDDALRDLTPKQIEAIQRAVTEVLRQEFRGSLPALSFPAGWGKGDGRGGPPVVDPVTMYVDLPLGENDCWPCSYSLSLEGAVDEVIELRREGHGTCDPKGRDILLKIAVRLRELAAKLESECAVEAEAAE